jgi:hypothetical protein
MEREGMRETVLFRDDALEYRAIPFLNDRQLFAKISGILPFFSFQDRPHRREPPQLLSD